MFGYRLNLKEVFFFLKKKRRYQEDIKRISIGISKQLMVKQMERCDGKVIYGESACSYPDQADDVTLTVLAQVRQLALKAAAPSILWESARVL